MTKTVLLDCDDVLLGWSDGFRPWMEKLGYRQRITDDSKFHVNTQYGISAELAWELVDKFNTSFHFGMLEPTPGAKKAVQWLLADDFDIHVITGCGTDETTQRLRRRNLDFEFGPGAFRSINFVNHNISKMEFCHQYPGSFLVDDRVETCVEAAKAGIVKPIFMENFMNRHHAWIGPRINNLVEFYNVHIAEKAHA